MYSWEIANYINSRNGLLSIEEANIINNTKENPQLDYIIFYPYGNCFEMWDREGMHFEFAVKIPTS